MLSEYAVEPAAIGADWGTFKFLIELFGTDKGRLISRLPKKWEKKVIEAAKEAHMSDIRIASMTERLRNSRLKVADFRRTYEPESSWIENAVREHGIHPFRAIVFNEGEKPCEEAVVPDDCSSEHELFSAPISRDVIRTADEIADALVPLAAISREIDIVDPYFDLRPAKGRFVPPLQSLLAKLAALGPAKVVRIHYKTHVSRPPDNIVAQNAPGLTNGIIPPGFSIELFEWDEIPGGEDFHDRFFLTDVGGLMIGAGLSAAGAAENATFTLLDIDHAISLRSRFLATSTVYARVGSAVRLDDSGNAVLF